MSRVIRTYDYQSFISRSRTRVRKRKTTKNEDRILTRYVKKNDDLAFRDILNLADVKVSASTLRCRLKEINLFSRIRCKKPFLTMKHKHDRLAWARKYRDWTVEDWKPVIWSDELSIVLGRKSRRHRCLQKPGNAFLSRHCDKTVKGGKVTLMVWVCFRGKKIGRLIACDVGAINADRYLDILTDGVVSFVDELFAPEPDSDTITVASPDSYLFMPDHAPCHTATKITNFLKKKRIPVM